MVPLALAGVHRSDHLVYIGRVGTGFSAHTVSRIFPRIKAQASNKNPFGGANAPRKTRDIHWMNPELVAEIEFGGWTGDGMVRQASLKGLREDKPAQEVQAGLPQRGPPGHLIPTEPMEASSNTVLGVVISKPDKALWPQSSDGAPVTKLDLAQYYEAIGSWLLEHIRGRPCSIIRVPDGIGGEQFFQRHAMTGMSKQLNLTTVSGDRKPYLQIDSVEGLIAVAQIAGTRACIPGTASADIPISQADLSSTSIQRQTYPFERVIEAASEMRDRLAVALAWSLLQDNRRQGSPRCYAARGRKKRTAWTGQAAKVFLLKRCAVRWRRIVPLGIS